MSGIKIPILLGSLLSLIVLVIQNRTPVIQITFLEMRTRPFSLGILVVAAVLMGLGLGLILQRGRSGLPTQSKQSGTSRQKASKTQSKTQKEAWGFRSQPKATSKQTESTAKGWDTAPSTTWDGQTEDNDESEGFWAKPEQRDERRSWGRSPTNAPEDDKRPTPRNSFADETDPNPVVEAEYRVVSTPYSRYEAEEEDFDDAFFDEFLDED